MTRAERLRVLLGATLTVTGLILGTTGAMMHRPGVTSPLCLALTLAALWVFPRLDGAPGQAAWSRAVRASIAALGALVALVTPWIF